MSVLALEEDGYRDEEARVARRLYDLTHDAPMELPEWLTRKGTRAPFVDATPQPEAMPCTSAT